MFQKSKLFYPNHTGSKIVVLSEAVVWRSSVKRLLLKIFQNSQENTCDSFLNKVASGELQLY